MRGGVVPVVSISLVIDDVKSLSDLLSDNGSVLVINSYYIRYYI